MARLPLILALLVAPTAQAHEFSAKDLMIDHPFVLATPPNAAVAAGYLSVTNNGSVDDVLLGAEVAADVAGVVQLHEMQMDDGIMRMIEQEGGIALPAGETVVLEQGGLHVMFQRLEAQLEVGDSFPATLLFEKAGAVEVVFNVEARGTEVDHSSHGN